jgi:hypothetical protein
MSLYRRCSFITKRPLLPLLLLTLPAVIAAVHSQQGALSGD